MISTLAPVSGGGRFVAEGVDVGVGAGDDGDAVGEELGAVDVGSSVAVAVGCALGIEELGGGVCEGVTNVGVGRATDGGGAAIGEHATRRTTSGRRRFTCRW